MRVGQAVGRVHRDRHPAIVRRRVRRRIEQEIAHRIEGVAVESVDAADQQIRSLVHGRRDPLEEFLDAHRRRIHRDEKAPAPGIFVHRTDQGRPSGARLAVDDDPLGPRTGVEHLLDGTRPRGTRTDDGPQNRSATTTGRPRPPAAHLFLDVHDPAREPVVDEGGPVGQPGGDAARQVGEKRERFGPATRVAGAVDDGRLVARIEHALGEIVHHEHFVADRDDRSARMLAGEVVVAQQRPVEFTGLLEDLFPDPLRDHLRERQQQRIGVLRQRGQVRGAEHRPGHRMGHRGARTREPA